jgi:GNAT superfamily N-acetyltransferase
MLRTGGRYGGLETVLVARVEGRLQAACKLYRLTQFITGVPMPVMGLAAVAVARDRRRRGLGAELCRAAMRAARDRGDVLSILYPFRPDYYEKLGWGLAGRAHDHRFRTSALPRYAEHSAVRETTLEAHAPEIMGCYDRVARVSHGTIERDERVWRYRFSGEDMAVRPLSQDTLQRADADPNRLVLVHLEDGVTGYALLRIRPAAADEGAVVVVRELVAESEAAYRGLLGYLAIRSGEWPAGRYLARPEERFEERLSEPRPPGYQPGRSLSFPTASLTRGPMLRLLDVPAALRGRVWFGGGASHERPVTLRVGVTDPDIPENEGPWDVRLDPGGAVHVEAGGTGAADVTVHAGSAALSRIYAGDMSFSDAVRLGWCLADGDVDLADRAFATGRTFWLNDQF